MPEEGSLSKYQQEQEVQSNPDFGRLVDLHFDNVSLPFQLCPEEIAKPEGILSECSELIESKDKGPVTSPLTSHGIIKNCRSRLTQSNVGKMNPSSYDTAYIKVSCQNLSTTEIIRLAGEKFIQSCSQMVDDHSIFSHPFASSFIGLSDEENRGIELVEYLLASAEYIGQQQFDCASKLVNQCNELSSFEGNPVQRLVYRFSKALQEKIGLETGRISSKGFGKKQSLDLEERMMLRAQVSLLFIKRFPFLQFANILLYKPY